jgi:hypothetical protein
MPDEMNFELREQNFSAQLKVSRLLQHLGSLLCRRPPPRTTTAPAAAVGAGAICWVVEHRYRWSDSELASAKLKLLRVAHSTVNRTSRSACLPSVLAT